MFDFLIYNAKELFWKILSFTDFKTIKILRLCSKHVRKLISENKDDCCLELVTIKNENISDFWKNYCLIVTHLSLKNHCCSQIEMFRFFNPSYKRYLKKLILIGTKIEPALIKLRTNKETVFETNVIFNLYHFLPKTVILTSPLIIDDDDDDDDITQKQQYCFKFDKLIIRGFVNLNELNNYNLKANKYIFEQCIFEEFETVLDINYLEFNNCFIKNPLKLNANKIIMKNMKNISNIKFNCKFLLLKHVQKFNFYNINTQILHINVSNFSSTLIKQLSDYFICQKHNQFKMLKIGIIVQTFDVCHIINSLFLVKNLEKLELVLNPVETIDKELIGKYIKNLYSINDTIEVLI